MKILYMTVGLPQSGKSTWARQQGHPVVNPDSIRLALHGMPFVGLAEPFVWAIAKVMVRALFLAGHDAVILDATNVTRKRRDEWKSKDWARSFVEFIESVDVCKQRAAQTCHTEEHLGGLLVAIERMYEQYEPVEESEL
jgi:predicted kinase